MVFRQRLRHLALEDRPRVLAPEVVRPEESALEEVDAEPCSLVVVEVQRAGLRHHDERALVEFVVAQLQHDVLVLSGGVLADDGAGELGQAIGEVDVGAGVVHRPSVAVAVRILPEHDAAESKRAVVRWILGADEEASEPAAPALGGRRRRDAHDDEQHESGLPVLPHPDHVA
ncbi:MAG: hypothetical protein ABJA98_29340 [Acidobacteriota bacterium]